jgi:hypothetical protein
MHKGELYKRGARKYSENGLNKMASLLLIHSEDKQMSEFVMEKAAGFEALWGAMKNIPNVPIGQGMKAVGSEAGNILKTNPTAAGAVIGAGTGAATAGENNRISGALMGGALGSMAGFGISRIPGKAVVGTSTPAATQAAATAEQAAAKTTAQEATQAAQATQTTVKTASHKIASIIRNRQLGRFI